MKREYRRRSEVAWWRGCAEGSDGAGLGIFMRAAEWWQKASRTRDWAGVSVGIGMDAGVVTEMRDRSRCPIAMLDEADFGQADAGRLYCPQAEDREQCHKAYHGVPSHELTIILYSLLVHSSTPPPRLLRDESYVLTVEGCIV